MNENKWPHVTCQLWLIYYRTQLYINHLQIAIELVHHRAFIAIPVVNRDQLAVILHLSHPPVLESHLDQGRFAAEGTNLFIIVTL